MEIWLLKLKSIKVAVMIDSDNEGDVGGVSCGVDYRVGASGV